MEINLENYVGRGFEHGGTIIIIGKPFSAFIPCLIPVFVIENGKGRKEVRTSREVRNIISNWKEI